MLQDIVTSALPHLPYFAAIILGGLAGNAIADRNIKLPPIAYITLAFVFVASLCVQGYFMQNDMRALLLLANAITGASLAFALTVGGDFAQPTRASKTKLEKNS